MRFSNHYASLELELLETEPDGPSEGDSKFRVSVTSGEFSGCSSAWVTAHHAGAFCSALIALEKKRVAGEATFESISPGELKIRIFPANSWGHPALEGEIVYYFQGEYRQFKNSLRFGFEFDPSQLVEAIKEKWVVDRADNQT